MPTSPTSDEKVRSLRPMNDLSQYIGPTLRIVRLLKSVSQEKLAAALSQVTQRTIRQTYISKIEKGKGTLSWARLALICEVLGAAPSYVVGIAEYLSRQGKVPSDALLLDMRPKVAGLLDKEANTVHSGVEKLFRKIYTSVKEDRT